jgi:acetyl esterase/lipase
MCLFHAGKDIHSPIASTKIYRKLRTRKIPSELHLYPDLGHDFFSAAKPGTGAYSWFDRVEEYLMQMGFLGNIAKKERIFERYPSDEDRKTYEKEFIWPKGKIPDVQTHQDGLPYIEWHIPSNLTTKAIQIIFSGGSYNSNSPESSEVMPVRRYLNAKGMTVVTMCYRSPRPFAPLMKHASAWQDLQRAVRIVRSQAARRGLDPDRIGIMGSSAGGHLALLGAVSSLSRSYGDIDETDGISCSVQWAVAVYPAYTIVQGVGTRIISNEIHEAFPLETLSKELAFDKATCPVLFIHGDKDTTVTAICSVAPWEHMRKIGVQSELHTFAHANHSFERLTSPGTGAYSYMDRIWEFLTAKGLK